MTCDYCQQEAKRWLRIAPSKDTPRHERKTMCARCVGQMVDALARKYPAPPAPTEEDEGGAWESATWDSD